MAVYIRAKRVTDPLDERVSARLRGTITDDTSSGSDHDGTAGVDLPCFSNLIHAFIEHGDDGSEPDRGGAAEDSDSDDGAPKERAAEQEKKLREILNPAADADSFRHRLRLELDAARRPSGPGLRRAMMARLREKGYNAGICKARWESSNGLTAGSYEYIDVIEQGGTAAAEQRRYIVDLGFAAEFEVARATEEYERVVSALPERAVALPEEVLAAVRIVAEAAQQSLKKKGLSVPPWRKKRYMLAKWLGPYRRTAGLMPAVEVESMVRGWGGDNKVKLRTVGFGAPVPVAVE
ncbi:hypothetical protein KSP39_PZI005450 [Platanthera zijinensis]|uniref:DUF506 family protein n=1 Tax=Platanthera zijinensis TaxID=2320716 RepID=A0AAP0GAV0_9ASPA